MSTFKDDAALLDWVADRLLNRYGESPNTDYIQALRRIARNQRLLQDMESHMTQASECLSMLAEGFKTKCGG